MSFVPDVPPTRLPSSRVRVFRLIAAAGVTTCLSVLFGGGLAAAHIDSDPPAVETGSAVTVGFNVEHGCDGSNTTQLEFKVPDGVTDAKPVELAGWTTASTAETITFGGGDLGAETPATFQISFTAPSTPGTIYFPVVQTCAAGVLAWIEIPAAGAAEPEHPAPAVKVTDGPPTSADLAPPVEGTDTPETRGSASDPGRQTGDSASTTVGTTVGTTAVTIAAKSSKDDSSNSGGVVVGVVAGVVVAVAAATLLRKRRNARSPR